MTNIETRKHQVASAWVIAGAQEYAKAVYDRVNGNEDIATNAMDTLRKEGIVDDDNAERILADIAWKRKEATLRRGLRSSTAIIRIQRVIDRNEEMAARCNFDQAIDTVIDGIPAKIVPVAHSAVADKIVCCVFRAVPTRFGRFCMKDVEVKDADGNEITVRSMRPHNFGLVEKHFGVHFDAIAGQRMTINASAYLDQVKR